MVQSRKVKEQLKPHFTILKQDTFKLHIYRQIFSIPRLVVLAVVNEGLGLVLRHQSHLPQTQLVIKTLP